MNIFFNWVYFVYIEYRKGIFYVYGLKFFKYKYKIKGLQFKKGNIYIKSLVIKWICNKVNFFLIKMILYEGSNYIF